MQADTVAGADFPRVPSRSRVSSDLKPTVTDSGLPLNLYPDSFSIPLFTPPRRILMKHAEDIPMKKLRNGCRWRGYILEETGNT